MSAIPVWRQLALGSSRCWAFQTSTQHIRRAIGMFPEHNEVAGTTTRRELRHVARNGWLAKIEAGGALEGTIKHYIVLIPFMVALSAPCESF